MAREGVGFFHGKYLLPLSIFHYESVSQRPNFLESPALFFQMDKKAYPVLYLFDLLYCHCITDIAKMVPKHAIHKPKTGYVTYYKVLISKNFNSTYCNWPNSTLWIFVPKYQLYERESFCSDDQFYGGGVGNQEIAIWASYKQSVKGMRWYAWLLTKGKVKIVTFYHDF